MGGFPFAFRVLLNTTPAIRSNAALPAKEMAIATCLQLGVGPV